MTLIVRQVTLLALVIALSPGRAHAETGEAAWLRYARLDSAAAQRVGPSVPRAIVTFENGGPVQKAREELAAGVRGMLGGDTRMLGELPAEPALVVATLSRLRQAAPDLLPPGVLLPDGYWVKASTVR